MNDYEARRQAKIKQNQALLAELKIETVVPKQTRATESNRPAKKRKLVQPETAPSRTSARIAAAPAKPTYDDDATTKPIFLSVSYTHL